MMRSRVRDYNICDGGRSRETCVVRLLLFFFAFFGGREGVKMVAVISLIMGDN